jgi:hypothetical protein
VAGALGKMMIASASAMHPASAALRGVMSREFLRTPRERSQNSALQ